MLLLSEKIIAQLLRAVTPAQCQRLLHALTQALVSLSSQKEGKTAPLVHQPLRSHITTKDGHVSLFMPASDTTTTGIKIVTVPGPGGDGIKGVINILSPEGQLKGLISATEVTAFRTALVTMLLLTRYRPRLIPSMHMGRRRQIRIVIFGAGKQAEWHARLALLLLFDPPDGSEGKKISVTGTSNSTGSSNIGISISITFINRSRGRLGKLADDLRVTELQQRYYPLVREVNFLAREDTADFEVKLRSLLWSSDVIFCCTPSTQPLFRHCYLDEPPLSDPTSRREAVAGNVQGDSGTGESDEESRGKMRFIALIGSYQPHMHEVETATLLSGDKGTIFVDSKEACLEEAGELITASKRGSSFELVEIAELFSSGNHHINSSTDISITPAAASAFTPPTNIDIGSTGSSYQTAGRDVLPGHHNVIFKCVGTGIMDLVVGKVLLEIAQEMQLGTLVDGF